MSFLTKIKAVFGDSNQDFLNKAEGIVKKINSFEPEMSSLKDTDFPIKTEEFKNRLKAGESLDDILPEAFALVREASVRTRGQRHYDVQLVGGIAIHQGNIAEMRTGEGKTLVATLPAYLNALTGEGVHVVTVNDFLLFLLLTLKTFLTCMTEVLTRQKLMKSETKLDHLKLCMIF